MATKILPIKLRTVSPEQSDTMREQYDQVADDVDAAMEVFRLYQLRGLRNARFWAGDQWTDEEVESHIRQKRYPFVFNEIRTKVDHLTGTQKQTRLDVQTLPREESDTEEADRLNELVKWAEQMNDMPFIESEVFFDAAVKAVGFTKIYWSMRDIKYGFPCLEKLAFNEVVWDPNSRRMNWSDCTWVAHRPRMSRKKWKALFPDFASEIDKAASSTLYGTDRYGVETRRQQRVESVANLNRRGDRDLIDGIEYYEKVTVWDYIVTDAIANREEKFDNEDDAQEYAAGLVSAYLEADENLTDEDGADIISICAVERNRIDQTIVIGDKCIIHEQTVLPDFPITPCWGYFDDGDYFSFVDLLIDPQIFSNRMLSTWDHMRGSSMKNLMTVIPSMLPKEWGGRNPVERVRQEISAVSPVIPVLNHGAIQPHDRPPIAPELFQGLAMAQQRMQEYAGGANALGLQENAAESGKAVIARQEAAGAARITLFDNLRLWRQKTTEMLVWYIKNFVSSQQTIRIMGDEGSQKFVRLDDGIMDTLREIEVDVLIDEVPKSATIRERAFEQLVRMPPGLLPPDVYRDLFIRFMPGLPQAQKKEILSKIEFSAKLEQEKAKAAQDEKERTQVMAALRKQQMRQELLAQGGEGSGAGDDAFAKQLMQKDAEREQKRGENLSQVLESLDPVTSRKVEQAWNSV